MYVDVLACKLNVCRTCGIVHCSGGSRGFYRDPSDPWKSYPMKVFEVGDAKYVFALSRYIISVPDSVRLTNSRSVTVFFLKNLEKNSLTYEILTESDVLGTP